MSATIDYYFSPISPFTYLAGDELERHARGGVRYHPVDPKPATKLLLAVRDNTDQIATMLHALLKAVWSEERNISDLDTLAAILQEQGLDTGLLELSKGLDAQLESETRAAIAAGVFGFPFYLVNGEPFWGQDRLDEALQFANQL